MPSNWRKSCRPSQATSRITSANHMGLQRTFNFFSLTFSESSPPASKPSSAICSLRDCRDRICCWRSDGQSRTRNYIQSGGTHLFNSIEHHIADDCNLFFLSEAYRPANGLGFDGRVPLRLDDVYTACHCEVKASSTVGNTVCKSGWLIGDVPHGAGAKSH